jgi:hypothetical protein
MSSRTLALPSLSLAALLCANASANERHFGYVYETGVLAPGAKEIEVYNTLRAGREDYYAALDHRLEFEVGVAERLMTSFYLNWRNETAGDSLATSFAWQGISSEWKWKLADPVADPVGLGLYAELTYGTAGFEIEPKLLLDKKVGNWLLAANVVGEFEFENEADEAELEEIAPDLALGASYEFKPGFQAGLEVRNHNAIVKNGEDDMTFAFSALYAGPVVSYATQSWWMTFSVLPQLPALYKKEAGSILELDDGEKVDARLLFSFHI